MAELVYIQIQNAVSNLTVHYLVFYSAILFSDC